MTKRQKIELSEFESDPRLLDADWLTEKWTPVHCAVKRLVDIVFVIPLVIAALISFPFVCLAIKLDSRGPIFYQQERVGLNGKPFFVIKYRSMVQDAEKDGAKFATKADSRVTRVGSILRKTRLDEIPQVVNVLRGEMSLVGPRPERPHVVEIMSERLPQFAMRTVVKPGLTGWAQVKGAYASNESELASKLEYDLYYIRNATIVIDLGVLLETMSVVLRGKGM